MAGRVRSARNGDASRTAHFTDSAPTGTSGLISVSSPPLARALAMRVKLRVASPFVLPVARRLSICVSSGSNDDSGLVVRQSLAGAPSYRAQSSRAGIDVGAQTLKYRLLIAKRKRDFSVWSSILSPP